MSDQARYAADDQQRCEVMDLIAEGFTAITNALGHVDRRRTELDGTTMGDDMTEGFTR